MAKNLVYVGVIVLAVIAVVLGYKIYQQTASRQSVSPSTTTAPSSTPSTQLTPVQSPTGQSKKDDISETRQKIANYPGLSASEEQKKELGTIIGNYAQVSDTLDITGCDTSPLVLKVKRGTDVKLINDDSEVRSILFGPGKQYDVPINSTRTIKIDSFNAGISSYRCNLPGSPIVGIFLVTE